MPKQKGSAARDDKAKQRKVKQPHSDDAQLHNVPKPESTSEYEGAPDRKPSETGDTEVKTETSSSSGQ